MCLAVLSPSLVRFSNDEKNRSESSLWVYRNAKCFERTQFTLSLQPEVMDFFETQAALHGISCEEMINRYLSDCAAKKRQLSWT